MYFISICLVTTPFQSTGDSSLFPFFVVVVVVVEKYFRFNFSERGKKNMEGREKITNDKERNIFFFKFYCWYPPLLYCIKEILKGEALLSINSSRNTKQFESFTKRSVTITFPRSYFYLSILYGYIVDVSHIGREMAGARLGFFFFSLSPWADERHSV
jgi:hypothetical protein